MSRQNSPAHQVDNLGETPAEAAKREAREAAANAQITPPAQTPAPDAPGRFVEDEDEKARIEIKDQDSLSRALAQEEGFGREPDPDAPNQKVATPAMSPEIAAARIKNLVEDNTKLRDRVAELAAEIAELNQRLAAAEAVVEEHSLS